jgi:hypothetical protein
MGEQDRPRVNGEYTQSSDFSGQGQRVKGVRRPTPRPKPWAHDVIRASYRLAPEAKLVWRIYSEFDSGQGCWAGDALLARLVGLPLDTFIAWRDTLEAVSLLLRIDTGRPMWFASVPSDFPDDAKLERIDKVLLAERLDRWLSSKTHPDSVQRKELQGRESLTAVPLKGSPAVNCSTKREAEASHGSPENGNSASQTADGTALVQGVVDRLGAETTPGETPEQYRARMGGLARRLAAEQREAALRAGAA